MYATDLPDCRAWPLQSSGKCRTVARANITKVFESILLVHQEVLVNSKLPMCTCCLCTVGLHILSGAGYVLLIVLPSSE